MRNLKQEFYNERKELNCFDCIAFDKIGFDLFNKESIIADNVCWFDSIGFFKLNENDLFAIVQKDNEDAKFYRFDFINDLFDLIDNDLNVIETGIELNTYENE